ncbi:PDZ and LIM domain protein Zasp isoform X4 [Eurytemora carolleeae]|uniref:PDZ and LIM domain protein Zasp isoform X4 n=1 Tax=Eurytemora carolleeae TaxID=1294199 RepID=UPI000C764B77|nr:PDZ and LIM domain protein Zasp isoform X4 [Eurytemora carolleeae]|eukprot:XP_023320569.1 PDZ and LIM domain protein Zasp-like isoform X4 [Eurytemora affinis]
MSQIVDIKLSRFENSPWGFRLHGGTDFGTPLLIQKVNISSLSESAGLQPGDIVVKVNGENVENLRHKEVQEKIVRAGNNFNLTVNRGGVLSQALKPAPVAPQSSIPRPNPEGREWKSSLEADAAGSADNAEDFTRQFMAQLKGDIPSVLPSPGKQNGNFRRELSSTPVHQTVPNGGTQYTGVQHSTLQNKSRTQTPVQIPKNLMNRQYNSPQALYSEDNIQEVLNQQAEVLSNGVKGEMEDDHELNNQSSFPTNPASNLTQQPISHGLNSETLRMVHELDIKGPEPEPGSTRMCPSPVSTLNRRHDFPAGNPRHASPSPAYSRNIQGSHVQTQGRINVEGTDDIVTTSCKPKKVGNSFQWPPAQQDQGPTACPMYISPGSRNSSPGPRTFASPTPTPIPAPRNISTPTRNLESPAPILKQQYADQHNNHHVQFNNMPGQNASPDQNLNSMQNGNNKFNLSGNPTPQSNLIQNQHQTFQQQQQTFQQQQQQQTVQHQKETRSSQQEWKSVLNSNSVAMADNAADFTRNFLSQQLPTPSAVPAPAASAPEEPAAAPAGPGQNVSAPVRGRGVLTQQRPGMRVPMCGACDGQIRGPFITAMGKTWCPAHFLCGMENCRKSLQEVGFVEEKGLLYCEDCYARYLAPDCEKCRKKIVGNCLKAMGKNFHPDCFCCAYCGVQFANSPFYLEDGLPYCETDWNELFTTKCVSCGFPIEAGDRWVEALNNNYHSQCFNCTLCKKNLEGQSFFVKSGKPFCKGHATRM